MSSDILVLDEPTAALPEADVNHLLDALRRLRDGGIGIIYVTHRLDEVFRIADRVTVLRDGRRVATQRVDETSAGDLVEKIVGRPMADAFVKPLPASDRTVLSVEGVVAEAVGPVSFAVTAGETLGLVGLRGAGHHTIGRAIFGQIPMSAGHVLLEGRRVDPTDPADAIRKQIGFVSSRRAEESLAANMVVRENLYINPVATGKRVMEPVWRRGELAQRRRPQALLRQAARSGAGGRHPQRRQSAEGRRRPLDGGKVRLLVLEEPTIGVDVGSKAEIYHLLQQSLKEGLAVLLLSSDFEEVERICHRALVFSRGRVVSEIPRNELTIARLTADASGGSLSGAGGNDP
jgi:ABC-type sugar transport system, ATPase component